MKVPNIPDCAELERGDCRCARRRRNRLDLYRHAAAATYAKLDGSPVTNTDLASDREIRRVLERHFPRGSDLTEEANRTVPGSPRAAARSSIRSTHRAIHSPRWRVDVLVALVVDGRPIAAARYQPTTGALVFATAGGGASMRQGQDTPQRIRLEAAPRERVAASGDLEVVRRAREYETVA